MKHSTHILFSVFAFWTMPLFAVTPQPEDTHTAALNVQPISESYFYSASSSVNIQFPGFALTADNGSLNKDLTIQI